MVQIIKVSRRHSVPHTHFLGGQRKQPPQNTFWSKVSSQRIWTRETDGSTGISWALRALRWAQKKMLCFNCNTNKSLGEKKPPTSLYSKQAPKQRPLPGSPASQKRAMKSQYWNFSPTAFFSQEHVNYSDSRGLGGFFLIILMSSDSQRWYVSELWVLTVGPQSPRWFATCCGLLQWTGGQSLLWKNHTEPNRSQRQVQGGFGGLTNSHLLKRTLKYDKMPLSCCAACPKVVQNRAKLKYESRLG